MPVPRRAAQPDEPHARVADLARLERGADQHGAHLLRKLARYRRLYQRPLPAELAWAQPYADQMRALMDELELRR